MPKPVNVPEENESAALRLWQAAAYMPETVRLLGTRYRGLFLSHARRCVPAGTAPAVADALAFAEFMLRQDQTSLLRPELKALLNDQRRLRQRFKLLREGLSVSAVERWKVLQWLGL